MRPVVQFYSSPMSRTVSVGICLPSSASTPQVGFVSITTSPIRKERLESQGRRRRKREVPCSGVHCGVWHDFEMAVGSVRSAPGSEIERIRRDFHRLPRFAMNVFDKLDRRLVQVLMFCSYSYPLCEQGAGWLFEIISASEYDFDLTQDGGRSSYVIIHDM